MKRQSLRHNHSVLRRRAAPLLLALAGTTVVLGCGKAELESRWRDREVAIDGSSADWDGALVSINDGAMDVGLLNDDQNLYICLVAATRDDQIQMMAHGFTIWFDPDGGTEKTFGIRFPGGLVSSGQKKRGQGPPTEQGLSELWKHLETENTLEILTPGGGARETLASASTIGIELRAAPESYALVYELKLPLRQGPGCPFGIDARSEKVGVGLETPEIERPDRPMRSGMGGGMGRPGGGRGRPGGGKGGGMGGGEMGQRGRPSPPEPLNIWATVRLADAPPPGDASARTSASLTD